jgi:hypothetical protein
LGEFRAEGGEYPGKLRAGNRFNDIGRIPGWERRISMKLRLETGTLKGFQ